MIAQMSRNNKSRAPKPDRIVIHNPRRFLQMPISSELRSPWLYGYYSSTSFSRASSPDRMTPSDRDLLFGVGVALRPSHSRTPPALRPRGRAQRRRRQMNIGCRPHGLWPIVVIRGSGRTVAQSQSNFDRPADAFRPRNAASRGVPVLLPPLARTEPAGQRMIRAVAISGTWLRPRAAQTSTPRFSSRTLEERGSLGRRTCSASPLRPISWATIDLRIVLPHRVVPER